jgi:hypothetical protein
MRVKELVETWEKTASGELTHTTYMVQLPVEDAARLSALAEMYPKRTVEQLITDLLGAALQDLESGMPYVQGSKVIGMDEEGYPLFEDTGPTPRFLTLARKHLLRFKGQADKPLPAVDTITD